jgi:hypothetical protein
LSKGVPDDTGYGVPQDLTAQRTVRNEIEPIWGRTGLLAKFDVNHAGIGIQAGDRDLFDTILSSSL